MTSLIRVSTLRLLELALVGLLVWMGVEFVIWRPGGTGLFDFPDRPIYIGVAAGLVSFPAFLARLCVAMRSLVDYIEAQLLMLPWLALFGSAVFLALTAWL